VDYSKLLAKNSPVKLLLSLALAGFSFLLWHGTAMAAPALNPVNGSMPNPADFSIGSGGNVKLANAVYAPPGYNLNSPLQAVRIYTKSNTPTLNIHGGKGQCGGDGDSGDVESEFRFYPMNAIQPSELVDSSDGYYHYNFTDAFGRSKSSTPWAYEAIPVATRQSTSMGPCGSTYNWNLTLPPESKITATSGALAPYNGYYAFEIEVAARGSAGWNMFTLGVAGGFTSYYDGADEHFALKQEGSGVPGTVSTFRMPFAPGCTLDRNKSASASIVFFDEDNGVSNQPTPIHATVWDYNSNNNAVGTVYNANLNGGPNVSDTIQFNVKGMHKYVLELSNVYSANGIQFRLPYDSFNVNDDLNLDAATCHPASCTPCHPGCTPGPSDPSCNTPNGTASCTVTGVSNPNPYIGQSVTISVRYNNQSAGIDWYVGGVSTLPGYTNAKPGGGTWNNYYPSSVANDNITTNKQHSGVLIETGENHALNRTETPPNPNPLRDRLPSIVNKPSEYWTTRTYTVGNNNPAITNAAYHFGIKNDESGNFFGTSKAIGSATPPQYSMCETAITWSSVKVTADCQNVNVQNPGGLQYYFIVTDIADNVVYNDGAAGNYYTDTSRSFDTFNYFSMLYPHGSYRIKAYQAGSNAFLDQDDPPAQCMNISCESSAYGLTPATVVEPGESVSLSYGVVLTNYTQRTFAPNAAFPGNTTNTYYVTASTTGGLTLTSASTSTKNFDGGSGAGGVVTNMDGPWAVTANYQGTIKVSLMFGGTNIGRDVWGINSCDTTYQPQTRPTMKITNGDIATGGGFEYQRSCTLDPALNKFTNGQPRYISPLTAGGTPSSGGLRTFAYPSTFKGSGADFAAYALGYIDGVAGGPNGFYTTGLTTNPAPNFNNLMFANMTGPVGTNLGGLLGGQFASNHCAADYFNNTRLRDLTLQGRGQVQVNSLTTDQYLFKDNGGGPGLPCLRVKGNVQAGARVTIYTDDDVCINGDITYDPWHLDTTDFTNTAPYLTIITRGNIYVANTVTNIAGLFIAQPDNTGAGGIFTTCADDKNFASAAFVAANCHSQLNIKGSVIAQKVYPVRVHDSLFNTTGSSEVFDYIPSMVITQPNLVPDCGGAAVPNCQDNLVSLPPVF
jgi:hypothetical protein